MAFYDCPSEYLPTFSSADFQSGSDSLSLSKANSLYARLTGSNIMSGLNTFDNAISVMGVTISSTVSSAFTNINIGSTSNASGEYNICIGKFTGVNLSTGYNNIAVGNNALAVLTTGNNNTAIGLNAGGNLDTSSSGNVNIGEASSGLNTSVGCVSIGAHSVASIQNSVAIGNASHANNLNSIAIGYNTIAGYDNSIVIGTGLSTSAVNQIVLGSTNETTQIAGLLNVIKTATFTLPSFLSPPIMNYPSFAGTTRYTQGYTLTVSPNTPINTSLTVVNAIVILQTITIPDIGSYFLETMIQVSSVSANAVFHIGFVLSPATQELARQKTTTVGFAIGTMFLKNWTHINITTVNSVVNVYGYISAAPTVNSIVKAELKAVRL